MNWKEQLKKLEDNKEWDTAIEFMQKVVEENPGNLDVYLSIIFLIMNLLVNEDYDVNKYTYYSKLGRKYFDESYAKFSNNSEYLFFTAFTISMFELYFDLDEKVVKKMMRKLLELEPDNILYQWWDWPCPQKSIDLSQQILRNDSIVDYIKSKGLLGEYMLDLLTNIAKSKPEE